MPNTSMELVFVFLGLAIVLLLLFGAIKVDAAKLLTAMVVMAFIVALLNVGDGAGWTFTSVEPYVNSVVEQATNAVRASGESDLSMVQMGFIGLLAVVILVGGFAATRQ